jgi:hypothetical protein
MNTLNLKNINLHSPYMVGQTEYPDEFERRFKDKLPVIRLHDRETIELK